MNIQKFSKKFLTKKIVKKIIAYLLLIAFFYMFSDFGFLFFLTFLFSYLFFSSGSFLSKKIQYFLKKTNIKKDKLIFYNKLFCVNSIVIVEYIIFIGIIIFVLSDVLPNLIRELSDIQKYFPFSEETKSLVYKLQEIKNINNEIGGSIGEALNTKEIDALFDIFEKLKSFGAVFIQIIVSLILSFIVITDRTKLGNYLEKIKDTNFDFLYFEYKVILKKITKSFGIIFKAQAVIAIVNTTLTIIGLYIIGSFHGGEFPYIMTLALVIFLFSFIPVLGTFLSSIPIIFIAYTMLGGLPTAIEVILLVTIVHMVEAYYLNPKIISSFMDLPVSLTFVILVISEHFFGFAGLLIGVSGFYFLMEVIGDFNKTLNRDKNKKY